MINGASGHISRSGAGSISDPVVLSLAAAEWIDVTFENSWVNFGLPAQDVQYSKLGDRVYVRGVMKSGATATVAFTLPSGYRPPATERFKIDAGGSTDSASVASSGTVTIVALAGTTNVALEFSFSVTG